MNEKASYYLFLFITLAQLQAILHIFAKLLFQPILLNNTSLKKELACNMKFYGS